jgi:hypothetical protein
MLNSFFTPTSKLHTQGGEANAFKYYFSIQEDIDNPTHMNASSPKKKSS